MSYRPICDVWMLARPKVKYYGAYPSGFLSRARELLGVHNSTPVLHVCSGMIRDYPFRGIGKNDKTVDINKELKPDFVRDVTKELPANPKHSDGLWKAILADPPYSEEDATHYDTAEIYPEPSKLLKLCLSCVVPGGRVGFLHYKFPRPFKDTRLIACIGVTQGYGNAMRCYSVYERPLI